MTLTFVPAPSPHIADYVVIVIFLCICMVIGVYYGKQTNKNPTLENYFLGNRRLLLLPVSLSLFVTFSSAITLMGVPAEVYVFGIRGVYVVGGYLLSVIIANGTIVPLLHPLRLISTYEYLQLRFRSKGVRTLGTMFGMLQTIVYMGVTLYAPALALQIVAGIPLWLSIVVMGFVGTIYTAIGGIKSVVWTDVFQCVMMFIGMVAVTIKGSILMGTSFSITHIATEGGRLDYFNFDPDPRTRHTVWGLFIGIAFAVIPNWCNQSSVQRISSLPSLKSARNAFWLLCPSALFYYGFLGYLGVLIYSYYNILECDPVKAKFLSNFNQLMPYFVLDVLRSLPGLSGIYISCLFSGALSTFSSGINALAANTVEDILGNCVKESKVISQSLAVKIFVFSYGMIVVILTFAISSISGSLVQITSAIFGAFGGPIAGLFFLGGLIPKANWIGAVCGSLTALVFNIWIAVGSLFYGTKPVKLPTNPTRGCFPNNFTITRNESSIHSYSTTMNTTLNDITAESSVSLSNLVTPDEGFFLYNLSYVWYGFIGFFLTLIIGTAVSLCAGGDNDEPVEPRLIFPICRKIYGMESGCSYEVAKMEEKNIKQESKQPPTCLQLEDDGSASPL